MSETSIDELKLLHRKIIQRKFSTKEDLMNEIHRIEAEFHDEDVFKECSFDKKEKSAWTEAYFETLENMYRSAKRSKEFFLHLWEVHMYLEKQKKNKKMTHLFIVILAVLVCLISLVGINRVVKQPKVKTIQTKNKETIEIFSEILPDLHPWRIESIKYISGDKKLQDGVYIYLEFDSQISKCLKEECEEKVTIKKSENTKTITTKIVNTDMFIVFSEYEVICPKHGATLISYEIIKENLVD